jgi:DNA-directed RNA polymerase subunit N (RpoN/RPB10)
MIIPVRCFTCGKLIADKWESYSNSVEKDSDIDKGKLLDTLKVVRMCCRRHLLGHVDLIDKI